MQIEKFKSLQLFGEGSGGEGAASEGGSGLTGDFEADFAKYVTKSQKAVSPSADNSADKEEAETEGTAEEASESTQPDAEAEPQETQVENLDEEFKALIGKNGKYNKQMTAFSQKMINERFKNQKNTEKELDELYSAITPVLDKLGFKRGDSIDDLAEKIIKDKSNIISQALAQGIEPEELQNQYSSNRAKMKAEQADLEAQARAEAQRVQQERAELQAIHDSWRQQEKELQSIYKDFSLENEILNNADFKAAIENGVSIKMAYEGSHHDELMARTAGTVAQNIARKTADTIATRQARPTEAGLNSAIGTKAKSSVNDLTEKDIRQILADVASGKKISF